MCKLFGRHRRKIENWNTKGSKGGDGKVPLDGMPITFGEKEAWMAAQIPDEGRVYPTEVPLMAVGAATRNYKVYSGLKS